MEKRMTVCNMSIEAGARAGMIAPDDTTFDYLRGRPQFAAGRRVRQGRRRAGDSCRPTPARSTTSRWSSTAADIAPQVTWGTNPGQVAAGQRPRAATRPSSPTRTSRRRPPQSLEYMGLAGGEPICDLKLDRVFIGSCTNARIEDLRAAAAVVKGHKVAGHVNAMVVPGSGQVKQQAEAGRPRPHLQRSRLRMARGRLQHVPGDEPRQARARRALCLDQRTATSKAAKAKAAARTWSRPPWPPPPRGGALCRYPRVELTENQMLLIIAALSRRLSVGFGIALGLATAGTVQAEIALQTRPPSETKEIDRDDNRQIDTYREQYILSDDLTIETHERLEESSLKLKVRITFIKYQGKLIWQEAYTPSLQERMTMVENQIPLAIATMSSSKSREVAVYLTDEKGGLVAVLVGKQDGRLSPVTDEELARLAKVGQAVTEFALGVLDRAEELKDSKDEADKLIRKLDQSISEFNEGDSDSTENPNESENQAEESK